MVKILKVRGLIPIVSGGDSKCSHKLENIDGAIMLRPRISNRVMTILLVLMGLIIATGGVITLANGEILAGLILICFVFMLLIFVKNGKGNSEIEFNSTNRTIEKIMRDERKVIKFDEVSHIELIAKLKSAGNNLVTKSIEMNINCSNGQRINLATGDDMIMEQAHNLASMILCDILLDDQEEYR